VATIPKKLSACKALAREGKLNLQWKGLWPTMEGLVSLLGLTKT
jgi:hypothetical protein